MADDVISMIKDDHREVERLFSMMQQDESTHPLAAPLAVAMVTAHSRAEEDHVYPVLANQAGEREQAQHSLEEHQQAEQIGQQLLRSGFGSDGFGSLLEKFIGAVQHHVQEEENELLPALEQAIGPQLRQELGQAFAQRRAQELTGHQPGGQSTSGHSQSRNDLYEEARKLDIQGRSSMTKEELAQEVDRAKSRQSR